MQLRDLEEQKNGPEKTQEVEYLLIESKVLDGEKIVLAFEKKCLRKLREKFPGIVIYFPPEIEELWKHKGDIDSIKKIYLVKKEFNGWILPSKGRQQGSEGYDKTINKGIHRKIFSPGKN